jgi:predicted small lipoprotein YifL
MLVFCIHGPGNYLMHKFCIITLLALLLGACGLKGPLYLPQDAPAQQSKDEEKKK